MPPHGMTFGWRWLLALGVGLMVLRAVNIAHVLNCSQRDGFEYYSTPDTGSYIANSEAMFDERPMSPLFRERIAYPFLLAAVRSAGVEYRQLLWLTVPLELPCVLAMALLGWVLTKRKTVAAVAAVLYALNPNGYQTSAILMPDWLNSQIMLMAIALLMNWALKGHRASGMAACVLLPISQMFRPTLFLIAVPLLLLLGKTLWMKERRVINALLVAAAVAYPAINLGINTALYGVPTLLLSSGFQMHACYVSFVRAIERNAEKPDSMTRLYFDEKHNVQLADPREQRLNPFGHTPIPADFSDTYADVVGTSKAYLHDRFGLWIQSGLAGVRHQLFIPPRFSPSSSAEQQAQFDQIMAGETPGPIRTTAKGIYPDLSSAMRKIHVVALFFTLAGVMLTIRRFPVGVTLFYAGCTAMIAMASTAAWHDTVRVRLLLDMIYTPILAVGLLSVPAWLCFLSLSVFAYGPRKLFHWPHTYMVASSTVLTILSAVFLLRRSGPRKDASEDESPG